MTMPALFWRKAKDFAEIPVESNKHPALGGTNCEDGFIGSARELLIAHGRNIVGALSEEFAAAHANIFVELDLQAAGFTLTGTIRSRAISAA